MEKDYSELIDYLDEKFQNTVTKQDLNLISSRLLTLEEFDNFKKEFNQKISDLRESINALTNSIDKLVKAVSDLKTEYTSITYKVDRHEKRLQQLAEKLNIKLEY